MLAQATLRVCIALSIGLSFAACSDDNPATKPVRDAGPWTADSGPVADGGPGLFDAGADAGQATPVDAAVQTDAARGDATTPMCSELEPPGLLPRPPTGALPCELLPPGFPR